MEDKTETAQDTNAPLGIVMYTDGGSRPNPGNAGWGAHGYLYTLEPSKKGTGLSRQKITREGYVLPSEVGNHTLVTPLEYYDFFGTTGFNKTNNAAEVDAIYYSILKAKEKDVKRIRIFTDSEYARRGLEEWAEIWARNNWKKSDGTAISNAEHWIRLLSAIQELKEKKIDFEISWVKGHVHFGNIIADKLATLGVSYLNAGKPFSECITTPAQGYWKNDILRHPFIHYKRMYFNSGEEYNTPGVYYLADGANDFIIGKKMPDSCYAIIKLDEPDNVLESIRNRQIEISNLINSVVMMRLDKVYNPEVFPYLERHGGYALLQEKRSSFNLNFLDDKPLTVEQNPAGLALRAVENIGLLESVLARYQETLTYPDLHHPKYNMTVHDVTALFYEKEVKQKKKETIETLKLKPEFKVGFTHLEVNLTLDHFNAPKSVTLPYILGLDLPPRNNLKRLETMNPTIHLVTWKESEASFRYATVIRAGKDIGIWSNFFASRIFIA
jgi:ribonuclease HI